MALRRFFAALLWLNVCAASADETPATPGAVAGAGVAAPQESNAAEAAAAVPAVNGKRIYNSLCARCHGLNLVSNGIGFDLRQFPADGEPRFRHGVTKGLRAMPAWEGIVKPQDLDALWAYIGSVNGWPAAK